MLIDLLSLYENVNPAQSHPNANISAHYS